MVSLLVVDLGVVAAELDDSLNTETAIAEDDGHRGAQFDRQTTSMLELTTTTTATRRTLAGLEELSGDRAALSTEDGPTDELLDLFHSSISFSNTQEYLKEPMHHQPE